MRALVTGGGGFLGGAIVRQLLERGDQVRTFSRGDYADLEALGVEHHRGDIADAPAVERAVVGCDVVFHTAAKPPPWGPYADYYAANVQGTQNIIDACRAAGVRDLIYTSSPSVVFAGTDQENVDESAPYPDNYQAHYPRTKAQAERLVLAANDEALHTVALRPHLIWGPRDSHLVVRIIHRGRAGQLRRIGGTKLIDSVYIDDAARAHLLAADQLRAGDAGRDRVAGKVYFISCGEQIGTWDMVDKILATADLPPVRKTIPPAVAYAIGGLMEAVYWLFHIRREPRLTRFVARQLSTAQWFDISAAKRDLGYEPTVGIEEGLGRLRGWISEVGL